MAKRKSPPPARKRTGAPDSKIRIPKACWYDARKGLWHVGKPGLEQAMFDVRRTDPASFEGLGVSVSPVPGAWQRIARLGGVVYRVNFPGQLLDVYCTFGADDPADVAAIRAWALQDGWAESQTVYRVPYYDDESGIEGFLDFDSVEEAEGEAAERDVAFFEAEQLRLSPRGWSRLRADRGGVLPKGWKVPGLSSVVAKAALLRFYVEDHYPDAAGLFWDDVFDPEAYSAPRGVLFPRVLSRVKLEYDPDAPDYDDEYGYYAEDVEDEAPDEDEVAGLKNFPEPPPRIPVPAERTAGSQRGGRYWGRPPRSWWDEEDVG